MYNIYCHYVDSCYPDYLSDHRNGDNEQLINASYIQENMESLIDDLNDCVNIYDFHKIPESITNEQIREAIQEEIERYPFKGICKQYIDLDEEEDEDVLDDYEASSECFVYAYLTWSEE